MSFPTFKYREVIDEVWDGDEEEGESRAEFQKQLETRFFSVVYRCEDKCKKEEERTLEKVFFWTVPTQDLEEANRVWLETVKRVKSGRADDLPGAKWSPVAHVRHHAQDANDTYETPHGQQVTKKCFWLNVDYLKKMILERDGQSSSEDHIVSPHVGEFVDLPLYDSVGCGELMFADTTVQEMHPVQSSFLSKGAKYFVLRTSGDSMNELGINDGDLILCQKNYQAPSGSAAIILVGEDVTLKEIYYEKEALLLKPRSTNSRHIPYRLSEGDEFKALGVFVRNLGKE